MHIKPILLVSMFEGKKDTSGENGLNCIASENCLHFVTYWRTRDQATNIVHACINILFIEHKHVFTRDLKIHKLYSSVEFNIRKLLFPPSIIYDFYI